MESLCINKKEIFMRGEFAPIIRFYFDSVKSQLQQCLLVIGPTGSGKTLACRYYGKEAEAYAKARKTRFRFRKQGSHLHSLLSQASRLRLSVLHQRELVG